MVCDEVVWDSPVGCEDDSDGVWGVWTGLGMCKLLYWWARGPVKEREGSLEGCKTFWNWTDGGGMGRCAGVG